MQAAAKKRIQWRSTAALRYVGSMPIVTRGVSSEQQAYATAHKRMSAVMLPNLIDRRLMMTPHTIQFDPVLRN
jgi:hypothetical protein